MVVGHVTFVAPTREEVVNTTQALHRIQAQFDRGLLTWDEVRTELAMIVDSDEMWESLMARVLVPPVR